MILTKICLKEQLKPLEAKVQGVKKRSRRF